MNETLALPLNPKLDLAAATPTTQPEYTERQMRQMRRRYVTVTLGHVVACGHPFWTDKQPARNCADCWSAYFKTNPELVEQVHNVLRTGGTSALIAQKGRKFTKKLGQYLSEVLKGNDGVLEETEG